MCDWRDINPRYGIGKIQINAHVIKDSCAIIQQRAQNRQTTTYTDLMGRLKDRGHRKINRGTIGHIVGEVSNQVAQVSGPSIYPSAIVVRKDTNQPGEGFWGLDMGTNPPLKVPHNQRVHMLQKYQNDVFSKPWSCNC
jgi:hypothetical protein